MATRPGRTPIPNNGRIARARPPLRDEVSLSKAAMEYDLQDLADRATVQQVVQRITQIFNDGGGVPLAVIYALSMPGEFSVSGSPGTNGGTFVVNWQPEDANKALLGPDLGSPDIPAFRLLVNNDLPKRSRIHIEPTTFGASVNIDASLSSQFALVATSDFTLNAPTNALDGQKITIRITQDGTGGRLITYDPLYRFSTYLTSAFCTLSTAPGASDYLGIEYNDDAGTFDIVAFVPGVA